MAHHVARALGLAVACLLAAAHPAAGKDSPADPDDLAERVQNILQQRCARCHGDDPKALKGKLNVRERAALLGSGAVVPRDPDGSQLLARMVDGSMPPGRKRPRVPAEEAALIRQWIEQGAPERSPLPDNVGTDYVVGSILQHIRTVPEADRPFKRYFSLNHLRATREGQAQIAAYREALADVLNRLKHGANAPEILEIEATKTVFAIDLHNLDWTLDAGKSFQKHTVARQKETDTFAVPAAAGVKSDLNLFDLVLLEYPYAVLDEQQQAVQQLLLDYVEPAHMIRPVPFVRADWFVGLATQPDFYHDLLQTELKFRASEDEVAPFAEDTKQLGQRYRETEVSLRQAAAELDPRLPLAKIREVLSKTPLAGLGLAALAAGQTVKREVWEAHFHLVASALKLGVAVAPVDAVFVAVCETDPPLGVKAETDRRDKAIPERAGYAVILQNESTTAVSAEIVVAHATQVTTPTPLFVIPVDPLPARKRHRQRLTAPAEPARVAVTVFAARQALPVGDVYRLDNVVDRYVHPLYPLVHTGSTITITRPADGIFKRRFEYTTRKPTAVIKGADVPDEAP